MFNFVLEFLAAIIASMIMTYTSIFNYLNDKIAYEENI